KSLCKGTNYWNQDDDKVAVDRPQFANRSAFAEFANTKGREDVTHLHEYELQERDQNKEGEQPIETGLFQKPAEEPDGVLNAVACCEDERVPKFFVGILGWFRIYFHALVSRLGSFSQKIEQGQHGNF